MSTNFIYIVSYFYYDGDMNFTQSPPELITNDISTAKAYFVEEIPKNNTETDSCIQKYILNKGKYVPSSGYILIKNKIYSFGDEDYDIDRIIEECKWPENLGKHLKNGLTEITLEQIV